MAKSNLKAINDGVKIANLIKNRSVVLALEDIAVKAIDYALANKGYENRTFNLHDSFGYAIYVNGELEKVKMTDAKAVIPDSYGNQGRDIGYEFLVDYRPRSNFDLVIVAGENYAATLEITYDLDVLTRSYQFAANYSKMAFKRM